MWARWVLTVAWRDEHPLADLGVGEALGDELDHPGLGRGERIPAAGRARARAARPARPFERVLGAELGALGARRLVGLVAKRLAQPASIAPQCSSSGGTRTTPISARARSAAANSRTASSLASSPAATSASASRQAGT